MEGSIGFVGIGQGRYRLSLPGDWVMTPSATMSSRVF